jgi:hypothetical protein
VYYSALYIQVKDVTRRGSSRLLNSLPHWRSLFLWPHHILCRFPHCKFSALNYCIFPSKNNSLCCTKKPLCYTALIFINHKRRVLHTTCHYLSYSGLLLYCRLEMTQIWKTLFVANQYSYLGTTSSGFLHRVCHFRGMYHPHLQD